MSGLESRARVLLRCYPPSYRSDRGEEMLGTLLEASPPRRNWPAPRDARSLIAGGLRARAALNRRLPAGTKTDPGSAGGDGPDLYSGLRPESSGRIRKRPSGSGWDRLIADRERLRGETAG